MNFKELHSSSDPLLIANVWDVPSAVAAEKAGYKAIGTSSAAMSRMLGYEDGEQMTFEELEYLVSRITSSVGIPLTVDLEAGYSREPKIVVDHIKRLAELGVVGINIEDSMVDDDREIRDAEQFAQFISVISNQLSRQNIEVFINVRTDTFLLNLPNAIEETISRACMYQQSGANGLFVPCLVDLYNISRLIAAIELPLNVMCMPTLPNFKALSQIGVSRISMGNFVYERMITTLEKDMKSIIHNATFQNIFVPC